MAGWSNIRSCRARGTEGDVAPLVVLTAITALLVMFVVQLGLHFHARTVLNAAAQDGARAAQLQGAGPADAETAARQLLAGSDALLTNETVDVRSSPTEITVTVQANVVSLVPFWNGAVSSSASGPTELFRPESDR